MGNGAGVAKKYLCQYGPLQGPHILSVKQSVFSLPRGEDTYWKVRGLSKKSPTIVNILRMVCAISM